MAAPPSRHGAAGAGRSWADVLRANLLTPFNALLGALLAVVLVIGPLQDAFFDLILVANAAVGLFQEAGPRWCSTV